jgi:hypothetical protein
MAKNSIYNKLYASLDEFCKDFPWATKKDWWDHNASINSGGDIQDPVDSADFKGRGMDYCLSHKNKKVDDKCDKVGCVELGCGGGK